MGMKEISKLYACSRDLQQSFLQIRAQNKGSFVKEITMPTHTINNNAVPNESATWLFRGSWLPEMNLALLLFEDVSDLMSARKTQAWAEVAQRLAHEIRNPLMPIRLTAERLQMKLSDKLKGADAAMLTKGTNTIINQVDALKMLVEALRSMGDGMPLQRQRIDLISILQEVKTLYDAHPNLTIELQTNVEHAWVLADADRMRQVFHNLVKNAVESATLKPNAKVKLTISQNDTLIEIQVEDNGAGFQKQMLQKAFEPYLTTKSTGTGLGLAIVKKIIDEHEAKIELFNCESDQGKITGARVSLFFTVLPQ
jgi:nitrogen fixation/metabolism regulation signal transduction histidine kinase